MESKNLHVKRPSGPFDRVLPALAPVLLVSISYVDPGKWAALVEGGSRVGVDLLILFNFAAILCQYLSARISVVTGKDLAQICKDEYDRHTCIFLGIQAEVSMILLDLTMILGISNGLNLLFGWDLFTCVFFTTVDAALFPLFTNLLERCRAEFLFICMAGLITLSFVLGVFFSLPEITLSMNGMLTKLSGESAFALMSLLGASIMPHNFYLHSSIVQQYQGSRNVSKDASSHEHLFSILCIFSGIFLMNYVIMHSTANLFYSEAPILLAFQDALMEQVFRNPVAPVAFLFALFFSNQITKLSWSLGAQVVLRDFLKLDIPGWLHCVTIRIIAIIPALYCVWTSGAEGLYQLLIFAQVMVALMLPSSVIPLFRIAASKPLMGVRKVSQPVEFLVLIACIGMLGLKIIFVAEMIFGNSEWATNLRWDMGGAMSTSSMIILITAFASFCLMLWLAATPLKSASVRLDAQIWNWDMPEAVPDVFSKREEILLSENRYHGETLDQKQESSQSLGRVLESHSGLSVINFDNGPPETIKAPVQELNLTYVEEKLPPCSIFTSSQSHRSEESTTALETVAGSVDISEVSNASLLDKKALRIESDDSMVKTVGVQGDLQTGKEDDEGNNSEPEEPLKDAPANIAPTISEGPGSYQSLGGRNEESGNGPGSLSRLAGLGRAARRQLAAILDEFWGQLFDFHGQVTQEAKMKKLNAFLGVELKPATSLKLDTSEKTFPGNFSSGGWTGSDPLMSPSRYDSPKQRKIPNSLESLYGVQKASSQSIWAGHMQLLDAYVQNSSSNVVDSGERRYSSVRNLPSSENWDYQPATVHGYQIASYLSRIGKDRSSDELKGQMESALRSQSFDGGTYRDSHAFSLGQKLQNGLGTGRASGFQNPVGPTNSMLQSERSYLDFSTSGPMENLVSSANTKKYYSMPDIHRDPYASAKSSKWDGPPGFGSPVRRTSYEPPLSSNTGSRTGHPLAFDKLSPSKAYSNPLYSQESCNSDTGPLWSRQPFEKFGVADQSHPRNGSEGFSPESASVLDSEGKLVQSFRQCIAKLLKLEGSDWLFGQNDGADEELIDSVAARERYLNEAEARGMNQMIHMTESQYLFSDRKFDTGTKPNEASLSSSSISSVPHCGIDCVWKPELVTSFGVWCIHRVLDLSLMESRPELWGKYTYVLNRLQGIVDLAFSKPRSPMTPCFCLQVPPAYQLRSNPTAVSNGTPPPAVKPGKGKCTTGPVLLDIIKNVETAISVRKGRSGTAAGDVAFPKGKENLASVLKRYKRRLSTKPLRKVQTPASCN